MIGVSHIRRILQVCVVAIYAVVLFPATSLAAGNDVSANVGGLLKHYAGELYGGIVGVISLMFLLNRRYTELAVFLFAAIVVAWTWSNVCTWQTIPSPSAKQSAGSS